MVVYGKEKLDEITAVGPTAVCEFKDGWYKTYEITPEQFGFKCCKKEDLVGGTPEENAATTRAILDGTEKGPKRDTVLMNAGAALYISEKANTLEDGVKMAAELIDSGKALQAMQEFVAASSAL
jgi:anthranilate phosphoribosyltransferase